MSLIWILGKFFYLFTCSMISLSSAAIITMINYSFELFLVSSSTYILVDKIRWSVVSGSLGHGWVFWTDVCSFADGALSGFIGLVCYSLTNRWCWRLSSGLDPTNWGVLSFNFALDWVIVVVWLARDCEKEGYINDISLHLSFINLFKKI